MRDAVIEEIDVKLGDVEEVPVFAHAGHARYLESDQFSIDALDDPRSDTFSLETVHGGGRFILRHLDPPMPETV